MESFFALIGNAAPAVILSGAFIDVFFITGYLFYGFALLGTAVMLYSAGKISPTELYLAAYVGTLSAAYVNYAIGYYFGTTRFVQRFTRGERAARVARLLETKNLFFITAFCRSITLIRPGYGLVLGAMHINPRQVLFYEAVVAALWVAFWLGVLVFGEQAVMFVTQLLLRII